MERQIGAHRAHVVDDLENFDHPVSTAQAADAYAEVGGLPVRRDDITQRTVQWSPGPYGFDQPGWLSPETAGLAGLGLAPFQINPPYLDPVAGSTHMGEPRE